MKEDMAARSCLARTWEAHIPRSPGARRVLMNEGRWFAWRPVKTHTGAWCWLAVVNRKSWAVRAGDYQFEVRTYALLP